MLQKKLTVGKEDLKQSNVDRSEIMSSNKSESGYSVKRRNNNWWNFVEEILGKDRMGKLYGSVLKDSVVWSWEEVIVGNTFANWINS